MASFSSESKDPRKKNIQITTTESGQKLFQTLAGDAGITQGQALHLLMSLAWLRVDMAKESTQIDPNMTFVSPLEAFILLSLWDMRLLDDNELRRGLLVAEAYPTTKTAERLSSLADAINERIKLLEPIWEERRRKLEEWEQKWDAQQAAKEQAATVPPVNYEELRRSQMETRSHGG